MVAPLLLGILGAGLASQAAVHGYAIPEFNRRRGRKAQGILDDLPEDAGIDDKRRALMGAGLLSVEDFGKLGFEDEASNRDFLEALKVNALNNQAAMDRTIVGEQGATERTNIVQEGQNTRQEDSQAFTLERDQANREHELDILDASDFREGEDLFWATSNALDQTVAPYNEVISLNNRALQIVDQLEQLGKGSSITNPEEYNRLLFELSEIDNDLFFRRKKAVYGDAEPSAAQLQALKDSFKTFTDGSDVEPRRRWEEIKDQYIRRNAEAAGEVEGAIAGAQETIDRLNSRYKNGGGWALENPDSYLVQPYERPGGGVSDADVIED